MDYTHGAFARCISIVILKFQNIAPIYCKIIKNELFTIEFWRILFRIVDIYIYIYIYICGRIWRVLELLHTKKYLERFNLTFWGRSWVMKRFRLYSNSRVVDEIKGLPISIDFCKRNTELLFPFSMISPCCHIVITPALCSSSWLISKLGGCWLDPAQQTYNVVVALW